MPAQSAIFNNRHESGLEIQLDCPDCHTKIFSNLVCGIEDKTDCWIGNFEGVAAEMTDKRGVAAMQFRIDPKCLDHINHFDIYGLANNHAMQHGPQAYDRTFEYLLMLGCGCFGSRDKKSYIFEHQNRKVCLTGFSQRIDSFAEEPHYWHNPEYLEIENELSSLPSDAFKVVYVHWGNEFINRPSAQQKRFAHWLVDVGYDMVIGMHPHILQGFECYKNRYIFYSLGNFVFDMPWEPTKYGAIVSVDLSQPRIVPVVDYIKIDKHFSPYLLSEGDIPEKYRFEYLNGMVYVDDNSEEYHREMLKSYKQYRKANHKDIAKKILQHPMIAKDLIYNYIKRRF